jgi:hypothetical protein
MDASQELALSLIRPLTEEVGGLALAYYQGKDQHYFLITSRHIQLGDIPFSLLDDITLRFNMKFPFVGLLITDEETRIPMHLRSSILIKNGKIEKLGRY